MEVKVETPVPPLATDKSVPLQLELFIERVDAVVNIVFPPTVEPLAKAPFPSIRIPPTTEPLLSTLYAYSEVVLFVVLTLKFGPSTFKLFVLFTTPVNVKSPEAVSSALLRK